eukprot:TRINITY_DN5964_c0_g1_i1.p1 TRINITY_DN5964_c0_g1~~TRINITY_DN5964_c0_g1_i1.p1  ORF type:complete len:286 (+),score=38.91 TRINITY_DN5964_c0_g1_i1:98-955(+)
MKRHLNKNDSVYTDRLDELQLLLNEIREIKTEVRTLIENYAEPPSPPRKRNKKKHPKNRESPQVRQHISFQSTKSGLDIPQKRQIQNDHTLSHTSSPPSSPRAHSHPYRSAYNSSPISIPVLNQIAGSLSPGNLSPIFPSPRALGISPTKTYMSKHIGLPGSGASKNLFAEMTEPPLFHKLRSNTFPHRSPSVDQISPTKLPNIFCDSSIRITMNDVKLNKYNNNVKEIDVDDRNGDVLLLLEEMKRSKKFKQAKDKIKELEDRPEKFDPSSGPTIVHRRHSWRK